MAHKKERRVKRVRAKSNLSKRLLFYTLALSSAFLTASYVVLDSYISINVLTDPHVFAEISWISGALIVILVFGKLVDAIKNTVDFNLEAIFCRS